MTENPLSDKMYEFIRNEALEHMKKSYDLVESLKAILDEYQKMTRDENLTEAQAWEIHARYHEIDGLITGIKTAGQGMRPVKEV